jgi:hypothetical protein
MICSAVYFFLTISFPLFLNYIRLRLRGAGQKKKETDFAITAFRVVQEATGQYQPKSKKEKAQNSKEPAQNSEGKNPNAVALGRLGGLKGGKARASKMTPEQRKELAQKAARARWKK